MAPEVDSKYVEFLGVDIGGSGMKAGVVDTTTGKLTGETHKVRTPRPATPDAMTAALLELVHHFEWNGPIGCTFPGVVRNRRTVLTAVNLEPSWVGVDAAEIFGEATGCPVTMVNDADAAAVAEGAYGSAKGIAGVVAVITLGTGVGSGVLNDGVLVPNTELGHLEMNGRGAEEQVSARSKAQGSESFEEWAPDLDQYLQKLESLIWPDLIVLGGGISREFAKFAPLLNTRTPVVRAKLKNKAGIVGAAHVASVHGT